jgi:hypothetical protein
MKSRRCIELSPLVLIASQRALNLEGTILLPFVAAETSYHKRLFRVGDSVLRQGRHHLQSGAKKLQKIAKPRRKA